MPTVVVVTEVATGREVVLRDAPAADAVLASSGGASGPRRAVWLTPLLFCMEA